MGSQRHLVISEEARAESSVSGQAHAVARSAVGVRHRRDYPDRAASPGESVISGGTISSGRAGVCRQRTDRAHARQHLVARYDVLPRQLAHLADRHQLDEPYVPLVVERQAREILDLVVVDAAHDDDIDLDRSETR